MPKNPARERRVLFRKRHRDRTAVDGQRWRETLTAVADLRVPRADLPPHAIDEPMALLEPIQRHLPAEWIYENLEFLLSRLTDGQRILLLTSMLEGDVMNGGFDSYLGSVTGDFAPQTLEALQTLGAVDHADVLGRAMAAFGTPVYPTTDIERNDLLAENAAIGRRLAELDIAYGTADERRMLREYWKAHIAVHADQFFR